MRENALISVIVPIYKVERYLNKCLDSIVNQTYKELEMVLRMVALRYAMNGA